MNPNSNFFSNFLFLKRERNFFIAECLGREYSLTVAVCGEAKEEERLIFKTPESFNEFVFGADITFPENERDRLGKYPGTDWGDLENWVLSRTALIHCIKRVKERVPGLTSRVSGSCSFSHCQGYGACAVLVSSSSADFKFRVGIDVERQDRSLGSRTNKFFSHSHEAQFLLSDLELWSLKEAVFKSVEDNSRLGLIDFTLNAVSTTENPGVRLIADFQGRRPGSTHGACLINLEGYQIGVGVSAC